MQQDVYRQGISEVVRVLLDSGCFSVDAGDESDKTPLHYAALNGADEVFQLLVENKADIDALDAVGATPLHFAVRLKGTENLDIWPSSEASQKFRK